MGIIQLRTWLITSRHFAAKTELGLGHLGELHVALTVLDVRDPIVFNTCGRRWNAQATCLVWRPPTQRLHDPDRSRSPCHTAVPHIHRLPQIRVAVSRCLELNLRKAVQKENTSQGASEECRDMKQNLDAEQTICNRNMVRPTPSPQINLSLGLDEFSVPAVKPSLSLLQDVKIMRNKWSILGFYQAYISIYIHVSPPFKGVG